MIIYEIDFVWMESIIGECVGRVVEFGVKVQWLGLYKFKVNKSNRLEFRLIVCLICVNEKYCFYYRCRVKVFRFKYFVCIVEFLGRIISVIIFKCFFIDEERLVVFYLVFCL